MYEGRQQPQTTTILGLLQEAASGHLTSVQKCRVMTGLRKQTPPHKDQHSLHPFVLNACRVKPNKLWPSFHALAVTCILVHTHLVAHGVPTPGPPTHFDTHTCTADIHVRLELCRDALRLAWRCATRTKTPTNDTQCGGGFLAESNVGENSWVTLASTFQVHAFDDETYQNVLRTRRATHTIRLTLCLHTSLVDLPHSTFAPCCHCDSWSG